ncbi:long-chain fatty acid--CoA ligase [Ectopseudomonas mendocina]|uniref:Long-chain-fatty-acid--CoA ligase n=1 Tax=Ectopseudomonas mendocina TaxID=300 RepID=A0ABD7S373_ECTME|nr:AMP-binding protein [Pseudomonas mendocina]QTN46595.1 AMP-binding protein [Pseudomonas mendocina]TRO14270.1 long-chain fatty acid--CoA ligase [Pseudomonas mendocina]TRO19321.1 long-chain fatty acid--CoA ligase [Pseudomonas mendocina]
MTAQSRRWEQHYPTHLQGYRIDAESLAGNLADSAGANARRFGAAPAFTQVLPNGLQAELSFADIERLSDAFAAYLSREQGLQPGDVVALQLPNSLHYPVAVLGAWKAGLIVTNVNPLYTERELDAQLLDSGARLLVACDLSVKRAQQVIEQRGVSLLLTSLGDFFPAPVGQTIQKSLEEQSGDDLTPQIAFQRFSETLSIGAELPLSRRNHPVALYQYTGGTTGRSKGAVLTHANLKAVLRMAEDYLSAFGAQIEPGDIILTIPPLYHIFAFNFNFLLFFGRGGHNLLVPNPRPLANTRPSFEKFPVRWMTGVDTLYAGLLAEPWFQANPPALKLAVSGGTALRPVTGERWRALVGQILEGYGLTESSCFVAFNPPGPKERLGTVGLPLPGLDVRIADADGQALASGTPGELLVRGPNIIEHYLNRPDETREAFVDGWFRTGDIAVMDEDGYIRIVDRKKDMVLVSGFNVYPNEVEAVIAEHPDVMEVAVIGVPDETTGEAVCAFVALHRPGLDGEAIIRHCRERLTAYKVPKRIEFREQLPKSPIGKILRAQLRT